MDHQDTYHMSTEDFRRAGYALIDWIADYHERVASLPVLSQVKPGEVRAALPSHPPAHGEDAAAMLADVERIILPGITHWQSPNFYAFFPGNSSGPAVLGELLSAGLGVQGMLWLTSPACTELETLMMDWLVEMMGLPDSFLSSSAGGGVIHDSASSATLCALLAARERASHFEINRRGGTGTLTAYATAQTHSSLDKAMKISGMGSERLRKVDTDPAFAMRPDALSARIAADKAAGLTPAFVCATVGTTSSNAIDPISEIAAICREHGLWLHVDAAMAGSATLCPEHRWIIDGLAGADSYVFNPHKWMFTNFDCTAFFVADRKALIDTLSILPEYLRNEASGSGAVIDYRDWQIPLGRRFRSLKLWFVIRHYGIEGLRHHIRRHVALAQEFAAWVEADSRFELVAPVPLNLICFRYRGGDAENQQLLERLNASGQLYLTHTKLNDRFVLRLCIGQTHTERDHVETAWRCIQREADRLGHASLHQPGS